MTDYINLINTINCVPITPDYLKGCDTYIVGHTDGVIQTFRSNCVYGGFRDLQVALATFHIDDIPAYIKSTNASYLDLQELLKSWSKGPDTDLYNIIKGLVHEQEFNLSAYIKQGLTGQVDLLKRINVFQHAQLDLQKIIKGWSASNVIDLLNAIKCTYVATADFKTYIKSTEQQISDLASNVFKIWQHDIKDIGESLHGWQTFDLQKIIQAMHTYDLNVMLRSTFITNITAILYAISPVDIEVELHGWQTQDLQVLLSLGTYDGDLSASMYGIDSVNLNASLVAKRGVQIISDLNGYTTNLKISDLPVTLNTIYYSNLNVFLNSSRQIIDLQCIIYPKVVFVRHNINISFLEHRDLAGIINFPCFNSDFRDLQCVLQAKHKKDLKAYIWGAEGSNVVDLSCYINASDYVSIASLPANYLNLNRSITRVSLNYKKSNIFSIDSIKVFSTDIYHSWSDLHSNIVGKLLYSDLGVTISPYINRHYNSPTVLQRFVTLKLKNNVEDFRRYVELTFNEYASSYYYFSGNNRAYREFSDEHWVVKVEGYEMLPIGRGFEKSKVRKKYIFNLSNYESIDSAIRDMVDRVTLLRNYDLSMSIIPITHDIPTSDAISDLGMSIISKRVYYTNRVLRSSIMTVTPDNVDLSVYILSTSLSGTTDVGMTITGQDYEGVLDGNVDFNFIGVGDIQPEPDEVNFVFIFGDD